MKKNKKSGIILITTLIFLTLTFMLAVMICKNGKESLFAANRYADNEQAYLAAVSGIEFIKGQLYNNRAWDVDKATNLTSDGILIQKEGNASTGYILTGYILTSTSGTVSNTNYDSKFEIFSKTNETNREYRSVNNLDKTNNIPAKDTDNPANNNKREISAKTFYAYVKGTCGKTVRYAEALFVSNGPKALDGGSVINGKVEIRSKSGQKYNDAPFITIDNVNKNRNGKITSSDELIFSTNGATLNPRMILTPTANKIEINSKNVTIGNFYGKETNANKDNITHIIYNKNEEKNSNIQNLTYDSINESNLESGTYAYINNLSAPQKSYWLYTNKTKNVTKKIDEAVDINDVLEDNNSIKFNKRTVRVTGNVKCSDGSLNFIVIDQKTNKYTKKVKYTISNKNTIDFSIGKNGKIETSGDLSISGEIKGTGKIYCGGNLTMNAGSDLETMPLSGVAIYANGNITVKEAKNLSTNSKEIEEKLINEALEKANEEGITLISSEDESDENTQELSGELLALLNNGSNSDSNEEVKPTEIVINGHTYDVTEKIQNYKIQEDNDANIITFTHDSTNDEYKLLLEEDYFCVYKNNKKFGENIPISNIISRNYHKTIDDITVDIEDYRATNDNYMTDCLLKIDGHKAGILDIANSGNTAKNYHKKYMHKSGKFIFSNEDYYTKNKPSTSQTEFSNFSYNTLSSIDTEINSTNSDTKEVTIQEYVEKYYKENVGRTSIRGSIYSKKGNVNINGNGKKFNIKGAVIVANGNLSITNTSYVNLQYDPDYVPFFENQGILTTTIFESIF